MMKNVDNFWEVLSKSALTFILFVMLYMLTLLVVNPTKAGAQLGKFRQGFDSIYYGRIERHR